MLGNRLAKITHKTIVTRQFLSYLREEVGVYESRLEFHADVIGAQKAQTGVARKRW